MTIAIIGAGPAGATAALELDAAGIPVALIDDNRAAGGQIWRAGPGGLPEGERLRRRLAETRHLDHRAGCTVTALLPGGELHLADDRGGGARLQAAAVLIAAGALEQFVPVPGWTEPGVISLGGLQILLKSGLVPEGPVLLGGAGPLLHLVATQLARAGADLVGVIDAAPRPGLATLAGLANRPGLLLRGIGLEASLRLRGVPIHRGTTIRRIGGIAGGFEADLSDGRTLKSGLIGYGFGLRANTELTASVGAAHVYDGQLGGWQVTRSESLETTVPGIFAAGDGASIGGVDAAVAEGLIAAVGLLEHVGHAVPEGLRARARKVRQLLRRIDRFRRALAHWSRIPDDLFDAPAAGTVICRCESVTWGDLERGIAGGLQQAQPLKMATRIGMGLCQGRVCHGHFDRLLARATGADPATLDRPTARWPVRPATIESLLADH